jgi:formylmethanofuran dehydrogenase subunit E
MGFLRNLFSPPHQIGAFYNFSVKCKRCGETVRGQVNLRNEPSLNLNDKGKSFYTCRKVLIGAGHCFQQIEVIIKFDQERRVLERKIIGGSFIDSPS